MKAYDYSFVANDADDLHCFQAAFSMVWQALTNEPLSTERAEELTGFMVGMQTWPFAGMLAFAERGLYVRNIEDFRPLAFLDDAAGEIRRQVQDDEVAQFIIDESDLKRERRLVERCLAAERITFDDRLPSFTDIVGATAAPRVIAIANVNHRALVGEDGYYGHFVVIDAAGDERVIVQDPGPPPRPAMHIATDTFLRAWKSPNPNAANLLVIGDSTSAT